MLHTASGIITYYWQSIANVTYNRDAVIAAINNLEPSEVWWEQCHNVERFGYAASDKIVNNPLYYPGEIDAIVTIGATVIKKIPMTLTLWFRQHGIDHKIRIYSILYVSSQNQCDHKNSAIAQNLKNTHRQRRMVNFTAHSQKPKLMQPLRILIKIFQRLQVSIPR